MWAAQAAVLEKADTAMRNKLSRFDLADRCFHQAPELLTLLYFDLGRTERALALFGL